MVWGHREVLGFLPVNIFLFSYLVSRLQLAGDKGGWDGARAIQVHHHLTRPDMEHHVMVTSAAQI